MVRVGRARDKPDRGGAVPPGRVGRTGGVPQDVPVPTIRIAQDPAADDLLGRDPLALLLGMLLDQQFPMERAFAGPALLPTDWAPTPCRPPRSPTPTPRR